MTTLTTHVVEPFKEMVATVAGFIPTLIGVLAVLIIGGVIAKIIRDLILKGLKVLMFDKIADKSGLTEALHRGGIRLSASKALGGLIYWIGMVMVLILAAKTFGLVVVDQTLERIFAYIPRVISAVFVMIFGLILANFVSGLVHIIAINTNVPKPDLLGQITRWAIVFFAVTIFLEELGLAALIAGPRMDYVVGAICLALALAFGLGGKDKVAHYLKK